jgi:hypothetical protein
MEEEEEHTVISLTPKGKAKKPRSEAQISATKRALEALQAKRKENWETKKKEIIAKKPKNEVVVPPAPAPTPAPTPPKPSTVAESSIPDWAKALNDKVDKALSKKKKKVVIQESESESEEEVIVVKKKKSPPPQTPAPIVEPVKQEPAKPEPPKDNPLRRMLYRNY